jgi:hypothetical protein
MKLKNYQELQITVLCIGTEDVIRTSGEEYGTSWNGQMWGTGGSSAAMED